MSHVAPINMLSADRTRALAPPASAGCRDVLLYDGVCVFCNHAVRFVFRHDRAGRFCYAPLASDYARQALELHGVTGTDSVALLIAAGTPSQRLLLRSDAAVYVLRHFDGIWPAAGFLLGLIPRVLRDLAYRFIARIRYRIFGRYRTCPLPPAAMRPRMLAL